MTKTELLDIENKSLELVAKDWKIQIDAIALRQSIPVTEARRVLIAKYFYMLANKQSIREFELEAREEQAEKGKKQGE
jgi:hypothetical protein